MSDDADSASATHPDYSTVLRAGENLKGRIVYYAAALAGIPTPSRECAIQLRVVLRLALGDPLLFRDVVAEVKTEFDIRHIEDLHSGSYEAASEVCHRVWARLQELLTPGKQAMIDKYLYPNVEVWAAESIGRVAALVDEGSLPVETVATRLPQQVKGHLEVQYAATWSASPYALGAMLFLQTTRHPGQSAAIVGEVVLRSLVLAVRMPWAQLDSRSLHADTLLSAMQFFGMQLRGFVSCMLDVPTGQTLLAAIRSDPVLIEDVAHALKIVEWCVSQDDYLWKDQAGPVVAQVLKVPTNQLIQNLHYRIGDERARHGFKPTT